MFALLVTEQILTCRDRIIRNRELVKELGVFDDNSGIFFHIFIKTYIIGTR